MKYVCFDIGSKRIGVAVSDPFLSMALPKETYWRKNIEKDVVALDEIAKKENADVIVCGLPLNVDGTKSEQTEFTEKFIEKLKGATKLQVVTADERYSTLEARRVLLMADMSREKRKNYVDSIAASYILEDYLKKL